MPVVDGHPLTAAELTRYVRTHLSEIGDTDSGRGEWFRRADAERHRRSRPLQGAPHSPRGADRWPMSTVDNAGLGC